MARRVVPLAAPNTAAARAALRAPLAFLRAILGPLLLSALGAQGVVPVLGPGRGPLAHDRLGARVRLHLANSHPGQPLWDLLAVAFVLRE